MQLTPVKVMPCAQFRADFPPEPEGDLFGSHFPGQAIAEVIVSILADAGFRVSQPEHAWRHGWDFVAESDRLRLALYVYDMSEFPGHEGNDIVLLWTELAGALARHMPWKQAEYSRLLEHISAELKKDVRFRDLRWCSSPKILGEADGPLAQPTLGA